MLIQDIDWEKLKQELREKKWCVRLGKRADLMPSGIISGRISNNEVAPGGRIGWIKNPELNPGSKHSRLPNNAEQTDNEEWIKLVDEGKKHGINITFSSDKDRTFIIAKPYQIRNEFKKPMNTEFKTEI